MVKAKTSNDTATREELAAVSTRIQKAVDTFVASAGASNALTFGEARDYVAAVAAHGKRGGAAAVQRAIADAVSAAGFEPYSQARYSKLAKAWASQGVAGIAESEAGFKVTYGLVNLSSKLMSAADVDAVIAKAKRMRNTEKRLPFLTSELEAARAGKRVPVIETDGETGETDGETSGETVETVETVAATVPTDAAEFVSAIRALWEAAALHLAADADRIAVADVFRAAADSLTASVVPADASALTDAA